MLTGCSDPEPVATIEPTQVEQWRQEGSSLAPDAQSFDVYDGTDCSHGDCIYQLGIRVEFRDHESLLARQADLHAFASEVAASVPEVYEVTASAVVSDGGAANDRVEQTMRDAVPEFARVELESGGFDMLQPPPWRTDAFLFVFTDPDPLMGLTHLADVMDAAQPELAARGTDSVAISYQRADNETQLSDFERRNPPYGVNDYVPSSAAMAEGSCFTVREWVFAVTARGVESAGTVDARTGRCAEQVD